MFLDIFSLLFGSMRIEVAPEALFASSDNILSQTNSISNRLLNISTIVHNMSSYWEGDVSESERRFYSKKKAQIYEALDNIKEYSSELKSIANNYINAEDEAQDIAAQLPTSILD